MNFHKILCFPLLLITSSEGLYSQKLVAFKKHKISEQLNEISGISIASDSSIYWVQDSGNPASIFRTNSEGQILSVIPIPGAQNIDWEAMTRDDSGNLYIADIGNNRHARQRFTIYKYNINANQTNQIVFKYPDNIDPKNTPDAESIAWHDGKIWLFIKNNSGGKNFDSNWYQIADQAGEYTAQFQGTISFKKRVPTDVAISPAGNEIAWISYRFRRFLGFIPISSGSVFILPLQDLIPNSMLIPKRMRIPGFRSGRQYESIAYLTPDLLIIGNEKTVLDTPGIKYLKIKR